MKLNQKRTSGFESADSKAAAEADATLRIEDAVCAGIIITNERDKRTLRFLVHAVGAEAVKQAVNRLAGARKPYLSSIAKVLNVPLPSSLEIADKSTAQAHIAAVRARMGI